MKKQVLVGVMLGLIVGGMMVVAEEPAINPVEVKTRRVTVYGTNPLKIGSTEMTEANLIAVKVGGTLPAVNGAAVTDLTAANITSGGVLGGQTLSNNTVALKAAA